MISRPDDQLLADLVAEFLRFSTLAKSYREDPGAPMTDIYLNLRRRLDENPLTLDELPGWVRQKAGWYLRNYFAGERRHRIHQSEENN